MTICGYKLTSPSKPNIMIIPSGPPLIAARNLAIAERIQVDVWLMAWRGQPSDDELIGSFAPDGSVRG